MISLLTPTRKRPTELIRMMDSAFHTAWTDDEEVEVVVYIDEDDNSYEELLEDYPVTVIRGPRLDKMTQYWNLCYEKCNGNIICQANDDIVFRTQGWNIMVEDAFYMVEDEILMVHGNDIGGHFGRFGPHPFVSRKWVEALGYFIPPYFSSDYGDAWLNDIANIIGRRKYLPFIMEHLHFSYGKCEIDETTRERLIRHARDTPGDLYTQLRPELEKDAAKLAALMFSSPNTKGWVLPPDLQVQPRSIGPCPKCKSLATVNVGKDHCNRCGYEWECK